VGKIKLALRGDLFALKKERKRKKEGDSARDTLIEGMSRTPGTNPRKEKNTHTPKHRGRGWKAAAANSSGCFDVYLF